MVFSSATSERLDELADVTLSMTSGRRRGVKARIGDSRPPLTVLCAARRARCHDPKTSFIHYTLNTISDFNSMMLK